MCCKHRHNKLSQKGSGSELVDSNGSGHRSTSHMHKKLHKKK